MAVMTTHQSEGALLSEKPSQTASIEKDTRNGTLEVNGHSSPRDSPHEVESEVKPGTADSPPSVANIKLDQDKDESATDGPLPSPPKAEDESLLTDPSPTESKDETTQSKKEEEKDSIMTDAPPAVDGPDPTETKTSPKPVAEPTTEEKSEVKIEVELAPVARRAESPAISPTTIPADSTPIAAATKEEDVEMDDAAPLAAADAAESTQETSLSDAPPITPVDKPAPEASAATDRVSPQPATADTSMSDAAHPSTKTSRERDIDSEDEPVAKRTKVEHTADQVEVRTSLPRDKMAVDRPAQGASPARQASSEPKYLTDDSLDDSPITEWQNRQIRNVLSMVKKTKVGQNFKLPVQQLWPQLWQDYSARVSNPTDISTMEKRLRGDLPGYNTLGDFKRDVDLLVDNSLAFNGEGHDVTIQAKQCRESILNRLASVSASEPAKPERKESIKQHPTRHAEPRTTAHSQPPTPAAPSRPPKGAASTPPQKPPVVESPAFAIPANNNGVPLIRRDSTKPDSRAKRPVKPALSKDLVYDTKRKKKLPPELRFCDEVLVELRKQKHYDINGPFLQPVDPVALNIPSYHKVIKRPMDLSTMSQKMAAGEYRNAKEFERDFELIVKNCYAFNGEDHIVYEQALRLQALFKAEMAKKDDWMAKHYPPSATTPSHTAASPRTARGDDSDDEDGESEAETEQDEEQKKLLHRLATIQKRLEEEQKKVNDMINSLTAEPTDLEIAQSVVAMLQKQLMEHRAKMAAMPPPAPKKTPKPKASKPKKAAATSGGGSSKKAAASSSVAGTSGSAKKSGVKKSAVKKRLTQLEREVVTELLAELEGQPLERAIELIKKDTGQGENDSGELELDPDMLSDDALVKLYDIIIKVFPNARAEKEKARAAAQAVPPPPSASKAKPASKSKKNKPMSKSEQERRIQQLNELRAQATGRQASGSQEPMESIETASADPATQLDADRDSDDEEDSEED